MCFNFSLFIISIQKYFHLICSLNIFFVFAPLHNNYSFFIQFFLVQSTFALEHSSLQLRRNFSNLTAEGKSQLLLQMKNFILMVMLFTLMIKPFFMLLINLNVYVFIFILIFLFTKENRTSKTLQPVCA